MLRILVAGVLALALPLAASAAAVPLAAASALATSPALLQPAIVVTSSAQANSSAAQRVDRVVRLVDGDIVGSPRRGVDAGWHATGRSRVG